MARAKTESQDSRRKAVEIAVSSIEKQFGKGAIMVLGDDDLNQEVPVSLPSYA